MSAFEQPSHTRPVPSVWTELMQSTKNALGDAPEITPEAYATITNVCLSLSDEKIDQARYYGLGEMSRYLLQILKQPDIQKQAIRTAGSQLANDVRQDETTTGGIPLRLLLTNTMNCPFEPLAIEASKQMPFAQRLTADFLTLHGGLRVAMKVQACLMPESNTAAEYVYASMHQETQELVARANLTARRLADTALTAGLQIFGTFLAQRSDLQTNAKPRPMDTFPNNPYPTIEEIVSREELLHLQLTRVALVHAGLRIDEFDDDGPSKYMEATMESEPLIHKERIPKAKDLPRTDSHLHQERLKCPALYVKDASETKGLIPLVIHMIPHIIIAAQNELAAP